METGNYQATGNKTEVLHHGFKIAMILLWTVILFAGNNSCAVNNQIQGQRANVMPPAWAPFYDNADMIRYYYFPDIECYYDVWNRDFIYPEDGSWMFGSTLPPIYSWFDLNSAFVVLLDYNVFEPWRHFDYYVSHYPRYYYRSVYKDRYEDVSRPMRGFNENSRSEVYRNTNATGVEPRSATTTTERRNEINQRNENEVRPNRELPERRVEPTRPPQPIEYHDRNVGSPVRVQHNMEEPRESRRR